MFDLWGTPSTDRRAQAKGFLSNARPQLSRVDLLRGLVAAANTRRPLQLAQRLDWQATQILGDRATVIFNDVGVYQSGYGPESSGLRECPIHRLWYAGVRRRDLT